MLLHELHYSSFKYYKVFSKRQIEIESAPNISHL